MLNFLLQTTPVATDAITSITDAGDGSWFDNLSSGDWLALAAIAVSILTALGSFLWNWKVHRDQAGWQTQQETQRQAERTEDLARLADDDKIKLDVELNHSHYFVTGAGPGLSEVAALIIHVKNTGKPEARLTRARITLPNGRQALIQPMTVGIEDEITSFPYGLPAHRATTINAAMPEMAKELKGLGFSESIELTASVTDDSGAEFSSNTYNLDLNRDW